MTDTAVEKKLFCLNNIEYTKWGTLACMESEIDVIIQAQRKIVKQSENYIVEMRTELDERIASDSNIIDNPRNFQEEMDNASYFRHFYGEWDDVINEIFQSHRKSFVISIFTIIENRLNEICYYVENELNVKRSKIGKGRRKPIIVDCYDFLKNDLKINDKEVIDVYNKINSRIRIRNSFVHKDSFLKDKCMQEGIKSYKYPRGYRHEISDIKYLENLIDDTSDFFRYLIKAVDNRYLELNNIS